MPDYVATTVCKVKHTEFCLLIKLLTSIKILVLHWIINYDKIIKILKNLSSIKIKTPIKFDYIGT